MVHNKFENGVVLQGNQAETFINCFLNRFENGVVLQGNQADLLQISSPQAFENGVVLQGNQAGFISCPFHSEFENGVVLQGNQDVIFLIARRNNLLKTSCGHRIKLRFCIYCKTLCPLQDKVFQSSYIQIVLAFVLVF